MRVRGPLMNPAGEVVEEDGGLAARTAPLAGKRVALLDNTKPGAEDILRRFGELLTERHQIDSHTLRIKPSSADAVPAEIAEEIRERYDYVITGVGD